MIKKIIFIYNAFKKIFIDKRKDKHVESTAQIVEKLYSRCEDRY